MTMLTMLRKTMRMRKTMLRMTMIFSRYIFFKKMGPTWPLFVYFCPFLNTMTIITQNLSIHGMSFDGVLGIWTQDHGMVGAVESTGLWPPLFEVYFYHYILVMIGQWWWSTCSSSTPIIQVWIPIQLIKRTCSLSSSRWNHTLIFRIIQTILMFFETA